MFERIWICIFCFATKSLLYFISIWFVGNDSRWTVSWLGWPRLRWIIDRVSNHYDLFANILARYTYFWGNGFAEFLHFMRRVSVMKLDLFLSVRNVIGWILSYSWINFVLLVFLWGIGLAIRVETLRTRLDVVLESRILQVPLLLGFLQHEFYCIYTINICSGIWTNVWIILKQQFGWL